MGTWLLDDDEARPACKLGVMGVMGGEVGRANRLISEAVCSVISRLCPLSGGGR